VSSIGRDPAAGGNAGAGGVGGMKAEGRGGRGADPGAWMTGDE